MIALLLDREFNQSRKCLEVPIREKLDSRNIWRIQYCTSSLYRGSKETCWQRAGGHVLRTDNLTLIHTLKAFTEFIASAQKRPYALQARGAAEKAFSCKLKKSYRKMLHYFFKTYVLYPEGRKQFCYKNKKIWC